MRESSMVAEINASHNDVRLTLLEQIQHNEISLVAWYLYYNNAALS